MTLVLDAGALVAIERGDRAFVALLKMEAAEGRLPRTHGAVVGQAWRGGARQALLAKALRSTQVVPVGGGLGRQAGGLLAASQTADVVDAAVVCIADDGDTIVTSDPRDLAHLVAAAGADVGLMVVLGLNAADATIVA